VNINCKFCNKDKIAAKSHIIPKKFYRDLQITPDDELKLFSDSFSQRRPKGTVPS